jgi:hypothetical protein
MSDGKEMDKSGKEPQQPREIKNVNSKSNINNGNSSSSSNNRSTSPNPFSNYLYSTSPLNQSPRSENSGGTPTSVSPRSPRLQSELFQNGMRIPMPPMSGAALTNSMLTAGSTIIVILK